MHTEKERNGEREKRQIEREREGVEKEKNKKLVDFLSD